MSRHYYIHPESGSAFVSEDPPEVVMGDPCVMEVDRAEYLRACAEWGIEPEPEEPFEDLLG